MNRSLQEYKESERMQVVVSYLFSLSVAGPYKTAFFGSNVTFNCSVAGLPKPNITWVKNNNSNAANSNPRARVIPILLDDKKIIQSQLSIREVKEEDDGKNYCVKKSSAGEIASKYVFLFIKQLGEVAHWYSL